MLERCKSFFDLKLCIHFESVEFFFLYFPTKMAIKKKAIRKKITLRWKLQISAATLMSHLLNKWPKCRYQLFFYLFAFLCVAYHSFAREVKKKNSFSFKLLSNFRIFHATLAGSVIAFPRYRKSRWWGNRLRFCVRILLDGRGLFLIDCFWTIIKGLDANKSIKHLSSHLVLISYLLRKY